MVSGKLITGIVTGHSSGFTDGPEHIIRQIAAVIPDTPAIGMGGDNRGLCNFYHIPKAFITDVAYIHKHAQSISLRSLDFIILVIANTPIGKRATTYELMPVTFSNIHKRIVTARVP